MTTDDTSGKIISGPWKDYARCELEARADLGEILLVRTLGPSAILPGEIVTVFIQSWRDGNWAFDQLIRILNERGVA